MKFDTNTSSLNFKVLLTFNPMPYGDGEKINLSAPLYSFVSNQSFSIVMPTDLSSSSPTSPFVNSHAITYIMVILGILLIVAAITALAIYLVKRNKFDRIRHHLMPLYNFDPTDEEPHWEADLLEDDRDQQMVLNVNTSTHQPKLKFHSHGFDD